MIILRIIFKHPCFLLVLEVADQIVDAEFLAPFLTIDEPNTPDPQSLSNSSDLLQPWHSIGGGVGFPISVFIRPYICLVCSTLNFRARRNRSYIYIYHIYAPHASISPSISTTTTNGKDIYRRKKKEGGGGGKGRGGEVWLLTNVKVSNRSVYPACSRIMRN